MHLIFHCYGGAHTSITTANLFLGRLPCHRRASLREILAQPRFDATSHQQLGILIPLGRNPAGHQVFCTGLGAGKQHLARALLQWATLCGSSRADLAMCDALGTANWPMRIGGFLSRRVGLVGLGRPLVALGVWLAYPRFLDLVRRVEAGLRDPCCPESPWQYPLAPDAAIAGVDALLPVPDNNVDMHSGARFILRAGGGPVVSISGTEEFHGENAESGHSGGPAG